MAKLLRDFYVGTDTIKIGQELLGKLLVVQDETGTRVSGMIVDSVSRVMKIPRANIQPPPETIACVAGEYLVGVAKLDDRMQLLLDIDKVLRVDEKAQLTKPVSS